LLVARETLADRLVGLAIVECILIIFKQVRGGLEALFVFTFAPRASCTISVSVYVVFSVYVFK